MIATKLRGHYNYYGLATNQKWVAYYYNRILHLLYKWLNRRSQRKGLTWDKLIRLREQYLPKPPKARELVPMENTYAR